MTLRNLFITGASSGLGRELAVQYADSGRCIGLLGRNSAELARTAERCQALGATTALYAVDVRDSVALGEALEDFDRRHPIDLLVVNAGVMTPLAGTDLMEAGDIIDDTFAINTRGAIETVRRALPGLQARGGGRIAVISSMSAFHGVPTFPAYAASKAALTTYFEARRQAFARAGIGLTIVCPSYVDTVMTRRIKVPAFLMMSVEQAATRTRRAISRRQRAANFPWYHAFGLRLLGLLPAALADRISTLVFPR